MTRDEATRRLSPQDYETIFHESADGFVLHPPDSDEILDTNEQFAEMLGYTRDELVGRSISDFMVDNWEPEMNARERVRQARREGSSQFEWYDQRKDGEVFWVEVSLSLVRLRDEEYVLASVRDISERKKHERRARAIFDQTYQFTGLLESDGTLIEANETALEFADLSRDDVVGEFFWECYWWRLSTQTQRELEAAVHRAADGEFVRYDVEVQGAEGTEIIDFSLRPITDDQGDVTLLIAEGRIITDQWEWRQRLDVYNRVMRHNLRNQLTIINGFIKDVKRGDIAAAERYADRALAASKRVEHLGQKIRQFDRLKKQGSSFERFAVDQLLDDVEAALDDRFDTERLRTTVDQQLAMYSDATFLRTALVELVENVLEHTAAPVAVTAGYATDGADVVELTVMDSGPGLPAGEYQAVVDGDPSGVEHPTGIGLWIAKWSVDELGGTIAFESADGGTTARIRLPAEK